MSKLALLAALSALALSTSANACVVTPTLNSQDQKHVYIWNFSGCQQDDSAGFAKSFPTRLQNFLEHSGGLEVASVAPLHFMFDQKGGMFADAYVVVTKRETVMSFTAQSQRPQYR